MQINVTTSMDSFVMAAALRKHGWTVTPPVLPVRPPVGGTAKLISDMTDPNVVHPHGIPSSYSFYPGPELDNVSPGTMTAATAWGVIFQNGDSPSASTNTRVEVSDQELWLWSIGGNKWVQFQSSPSPTGGHYNEPDPSGASFHNSNKAALLRAEADGTSDMMEAGYWFHFWPTGSRASINPSDIGGVCTWYKARLVLDNPSGPDDRASCHLVGSAGADWWQNLSAPWPQNSQVCYARFTSLPTDGSWAYYTGNSWTATALNANPPPFPG